VGASRSAATEPGQTVAVSDLPKRVFRLRPARGVSFGVVILALALLCTIVPGPLAPYDPDQLGVGDLLDPPTLQHLMGTDEFGRDILSRIIYSARVELLVSIAGVGLAVVLGVPLGLVSGYRGGWLDAVAMRIQEGLLAFPAILFAILVVVAFGTSAISIILTVGVVYLPRFARLIRGVVLVLKGQEFILASRACGASEPRLIFRHVLPNCIAPILVLVTLAMGVAVLIEAGLSYLGLGVQPPTATWGTMLQHAQSYPAQAPWYVLAPGFCIFLLVLALNLIGDTLRDTLDPRLRGTPSN
jgi:peptide/nickel transport system permease protein